MITREWKTVDKSAWGPGLWQDEPDKKQWTDQATGLPCLLKRNRAGALCGYVGMSEGHPWHGKDWTEVEPFPEVHGGLTYAAPCMEDGDQARTICHIPEPGEPDNVWWLGFDCAHSGDLCPAYAHHLVPRFQDTYKPMAYVEAECAELAQQAIAAATSRVA
jgi:hypothetical protein